MKEYRSFKCNRCRRTTIVLTGEVVRNRFLVCTQCSSKDIKQTDEFEDLKECMNHSKYKRQGGAIKQIK